MGTNHNLAFADGLLASLLTVPARRRLFVRLLACSCIKWHLVSLALSPPACPLFQPGSHHRLAAPWLSCRYDVRGRRPMTAIAALGCSSGSTKRPCGPKRKSFCASSSGKRGRGALSWRGSSSAAAVLFAICVRLSGIHFSEHRLLPRPTHIWSTSERSDALYAGPAFGHHGLCL